MSARRDRPGTPDAGVPLVRALLADAAAAGCAARVVSATARDWASATFVGARHHIVIAVTGEGADGWTRHLPEADLPLWQHIVADLTIDAVTTVGEERHVTIAALTLVAA
ncbi:hypothetical protein [Sphingomonas sp. CFBP 8760]|uniref:hypothetical protein n=1 Tax=Sphingomonas sp. CFBP 8760 TaxID=2775282 RepID=UPI00177FCC81|nr:hypothetical protein [Sphingomonas sp. CFBP 8760]MBD8548520.1 hypothetical protein [Sphingomonas sp. CFBP 8760]